MSIKSIQRDGLFAKNNSHVIMKTQYEMIFPTLYSIFTASGCILKIRPTDSASHDSIDFRSVESIDIQDELWRILIEICRKHNYLNNYLKILHSHLCKIMKMDSWNFIFGLILCLPAFNEYQWFIGPSNPKNRTKVGKKLT